MNHHTKRTDNINPTNNINRGKNYTEWIIKSILTILFLAFCLSVWPGYLIYNDYLSYSYTGKAGYTDFLTGSNTVKQYFIPQYSHLEDIEFVLVYDETDMENAEVLFSLSTENGENLLSRNMPLADIPKEEYYTVPVQLTLKPGTTYYWSLSLPDNWKGQWQIMYTNEIANQATESLYATIDDIVYGGATTKIISQYRYHIHKDKAVILGGYWISALLLYLIALEIIDRMLHKQQSLDTSALQSSSSSNP